MRSRILVAVVGVPILLYVVLWGPPLLLLGALALLAGVGGWELYRCVGGKRDSFLAVAAVLIPCFTVEWCYDRPELVGAWFILSALAVFTYAIFRGGAVRFHQIAAVLFGGIAIGYSFSSFLRIYASGVSRAYLLLPFILSFACDTFAYFTGPQGQPQEDGGGFYRRTGWQCALRPALCLGDKSLVRRGDPLRAYGPAVPVLRRGGPDRRFKLLPY